jgi:pantetheine-phosphate adenylyltransferase
MNQTADQIAIYPGSFDPITLGHIDIIHRLAPLYDSFVVVVANSRSKTCLFSAGEREQLIRTNLETLPNVRVEAWDGLIVDFAKKVNARVIVRGLRAVSDFEIEFAMASMNRKLAIEVETMIAFTRPEFMHVASRMVKEVAYYGGDLQGLVPENVKVALKKKLKKD